MQSFSVCFLFARKGKIRFCEDILFLKLFQVHKRAKVRFCKDTCKFFFKLFYFIKIANSVSKRNIFFQTVLTPKRANLNVKIYSIFSCFYFIKTASSDCVVFFYSSATCYVPSFCLY